MEAFSALLALCVGNSPVTGEFPTQRPVTRSFDFSFDLRLNKRLSKQSWDWLFETPSRPLWRPRNVHIMLYHGISDSTHQWDDLYVEELVLCEMCVAFMFFFGFIFFFLYNHVLKHISNSPVSYGVSILRALGIISCMMMGPHCLTLCAWWRHMETPSALMALCEGNPMDFPLKCPMMQGFDDFFVTRPNKLLNKQTS